MNLPGNLIIFFLIRPILNNIRNRERTIICGGNLCSTVLQPEWIGLSLSPFFHWNFCSIGDDMAAVWCVQHRSGWNLTGHKHFRNTHLSQPWLGAHTYSNPLGQLRGWSAVRDKWCRLGVHNSPVTWHAQAQGCVAQVCWLCLPKA